MKTVVLDYLNGGVYILDGIYTEEEEIIEDLKNKGIETGVAHIYYMTTHQDVFRIYVL